MTTTTIDYNKLTKKSYSYNVKKVDTIILQNFDDFEGQVDTISASGSTLTVNLNNNKTLKFTSIPNPNNINFTGSYINTMQGFYNDTFKTSWIPTKGTTVNGSVFDENIDVHLYANAKNKGLTIKANAGDDNITGTKYNDAITGGAGKNTIIYDSSFFANGFGDDTVTLTKGETLNITFTDDYTLSYSQAKTKSNLLVTVKSGDVVKGTITLKNYYSKETGATVIIDGTNLAKEHILPEINAENYFQVEGQKVKTSYTGSALADTVDGSGYIAKNKDGSENIKNTKGLTLKGGAGDDIITGSKYIDTIKGGNGDDTITGGIGNDKLYGEGGENTFVFNKGDNDDIVYNGKGSDTLKFADSADLTFEQAKQDLIIRYNYTGEEDNKVAQDSVTIKGYYDKKNNVVSSVKYITLLGKTFGVEELRTLMADPNFQIVMNEDYEVPEEHKDENQVIIVENDGENPINIITKDGDDTIYGSENGVSNINAGNGDNEVHGGNGGTITTGTGDDTIYGGTNNVIESGSGNDTIYGGEGGTIDAGTGNDTIYGGNENEINAGVGEDEIHAGTNNIVDAGAGNDTVYGGEGGTIDGGAGDDTIYTGNAESVNGGTGDDIIHLEDDSNEIHIGNNNGNDTIIFDEKQEEGNTIVFDDKTLAEVEDENTGITFTKDGDDLVVNTGGNNTVTLDDYLNQNNENISETIIEGSDGESTTLTEIINDKGIDIEGVGNIQGTQYKDNITGSDSNDTISAGIGNDNVNAGAGHDTIYGNAQGVTGGTGSNIIDGGAGNDTIHLQEVHNEIHFNGNYGNDTLVYDEHQENGNTIVFDDKTLAQIEDDNTGIQINKDGDDIIVNFKDGSNNSVKIQDYLNAGAQEKLSETVIKGSDGANSTTLAEIIDEKGINIEGTGEFSGTQYKDNITGSDEIDIVNAGAGNDTVDAGAGADTISGGAGSDIIYGGAGNDVIYGNDQLVTGGTGSNVIDGGAGNDTIHLQETHNEVHFSGNFGQDTVIFDSAQENGNDVIFENKTLAQINENATFSKLDDDLTMSFEGEAGNSVTFKEYFNAGNENITETTVKGSDGATQSTNIDSMLANATITVTGSGNINGTQYKDDITGSANSDIINAGAGADIVDGGAGNDTITGGAGNDILSGGTGENTFIFNSGDGVDHILDATNDDVIRIDSVGEVDIEQITEDDVKKLQITYNGGTVITNYDFVNPENTNIDTIKVKQADGSYQEISIKENVIVPVEVEGDYNKTSDLKENLIIADDAGDITVTGLTVKDKITFAEGNDPEYSLSEGGLVVEGDTTTVTVAQAGADMTHRVFINGVADDLSDKTLTVTGLNSFDGTDLGFGNYDVTGTDELDIFITGDGNDTINGGAGGDILAAGGGDDVVNGGDGNDVILGEAGNDILTGGAGSDQFTFAKGHGHDVITDSTNDDTITFDTTISGFDNISFARGTQPGQTDTSLYITYGDNENPDTIEVQNYFVNDGEKYVMSDTAINTVALGTTAYDLEWKASPSEEEEGMYLTIKAPDDDQPYTIPAVEGIKNDITGNAGDNIITGSAQNDIITGGQGDDTINAGEGYNKICYNLGDGDDTILNGDGTDTLVFAEDTKVIATYGTGDRANDLVVTYSAEDGSNSGTIILKDYKDGHSVQSVKIGDGEAQDIADLISIGQIDYYNQSGEWQSHYRAAFGTDDSETLTSTGGHEYENYHSYAGNDKIAIQTTFDNDGDLQPVQNYIYFKTGDGNDTIVNSERVKEGAALYSNEQAAYQERLFKPVAGNPKDSWLEFMNIDPNNITAERDGNDIVVHYTNNDSVRIKNGYYSTNIGRVAFYEADTTGTKRYYGEAPGTADWHEITDYYHDNNYHDVTLKYLSEFVPGETVSGDGNLNGWIWNDTITGGDGDDNINGHNGNDTIDGRAGNDTIYGGSENDTINGGDGDDVIYGYRELLDGESLLGDSLVDYARDDDTIYGGAGNDTIYGGLGNDYIDGGSGDDTIYGPQYEDYAGYTNFITSTIKGGTGSDTIQGIGTIYADDVVINGNTVTDVEAGAGNDNILGAGTIYAGYGDDIIDFRGGYYNEIEWQAPEYVKGYLYAGAGNDTITISDDNGGIYTTLYKDAEVYAGAGDDTITGQAMTLIDGGAGNDRIDIVQANDFDITSVTDGGEGDDIVEFTRYTNRFDLGNHTIRNSGGTDTVLINKVPFNTVINNGGETTKSAPAAFLDLTIDNDGNIISTGTDVYMAYSEDFGDKEKSLKFEGVLTEEGIETEIFDNIYIKNQDSLYWNYNESGANLQHGYRTLNIENLKTALAEYLHNNTEFTSLSDALENGGEEVKTALADIAQDLDGNYGIWEYSLYRPTYTDEDGVVHSIFNSDDEGVYGDSTDQTLTSHFDPYYRGDTRYVSHNEFIVGGSGNETINSLSFGNDLIYGGAGNDTINANEGDDTIYGEEGDDIINAGDGDDYINGGAGNDTIDAGDGADFIDSGAGDDTIVAGGGNDTIIGGLGDDTLTGGAGANTFIFTPGDGTDHIIDANTTDVIQIDAASNFEITKNNENKLQIAYDGGTIIIDNYDFDTTNNIDVLKIKQTDGTYQEFSIRENFFNTIEGTDGVDNLVGTANNDIITGKKADDTINAGLGRNSIRFALGDGADIIANGGGTDTLVFEEGTKVTTSRSGDNLMVTYSALDGTNAATITVTDFYGEDEHSVKYIKIGGHTYSVNDFYSLSRGDEALTDLTVTSDSPIILTLANPFGESNYQYTISTSEAEAQTFSLEYLANGRLVVAGDNLNIDASSGQADDIIVKGDYNIVDTGDRDDIVRLGGSIDSQTFVQSDGNIVDTGAGNDHVVYYGLQNDIDMGEGTSDSVLAVAQDSTSTVENAEFNRYMYENEPSTSVNGTITTFDQGSVGDCRLLAILESLGEKETFTNAVKITDNGDTYTVQFKNYVHAGKANSVDIAKSELTGFTNAYGDLDVVLTDMALNKLLKANNDSFKMANMTYVETATYNKLGDYFYGQNKVTAALYDPSMAGLSYDYQARVVDMWNKFQSGEIKNLSVGFMCEDNLDLGIVSGHAYAVKNLVSGENGYITLVNVWDNKDVLNLDLATFYTLNANVYSYGQDYYGEGLNINNVDPPLVREGTNGDDTFTATADNEIFNLHKGDDTVNFGADFGNDQINSEYEYNYDKDRKNIDTLNFSNYSIKEGTLSVGADEEGDLVLTAASANGEHGGSVAYNDFAGGKDLPYVVVNDTDTEYWAYGIPFQKQNGSAFYRFISTNSSANDHTNIISLSNGTQTKSETFSTFHIQSERYWEENKNVFVTSGGLNTDYWNMLDPYKEEFEDYYGNKHPYYMPDDTVVTYDGDDSYEVRALNDKVKLRIVDAGGNDTMVINDDKLENLRLLFNVNADGSYDNVNMKIVNKNMIDESNFESVYNSSSLGIRVEATAGSNGQGEGIENIYAYGHSVTNVKEWKDAVAGQVSAWLTANNFTDVEDALAHGTGTQKIELYEKFNTDYTATLDSRVISTIQTYQAIYPGYDGAGVRGIGTDGDDTIVPINARGTFYNFYTFEGDDTVILPGTYFSSFYSLDYGHESTIYFKPGDGNDTLLNSDIIADNDVKWSYSDAEVDKMQKVLDRNDGTVCTTDLCFKDVAPENLTVTPDGNDILITYTTNTTTDTVRIKDGMYSTNIRNLVTYTTDYEPPVEPEPNGYYTKEEDGEMVWHDISGEYNENAKGRIPIGGGSYEEVDIYKETSNRELQDVLTVDPISNIGGEAATLKGWIWKDNITAGDNGDTIDGCGGNDTLTGGMGDDTIYGGYGTDTITGGAGNDIIYGDSPVAKDEDRKYIVGDTIDGGDGDDRIYGASTYTGGKYRWADANISGGAGNDKITGAGTIDGGDGDDFVKFNEMQTYTTPQTISGGNGNDTIVGHGQQNLNANVLGGSGNDYFLVSSNYKDSEEGNELERIDLVSGYGSGVRPVFMGTVDMGSGNDHVRISKTQYALTVDGGVDNDVIEVAAPTSVSNYKNITIKNSGGHDAVNLVSADTNKAFDYDIGVVYDEGQYVSKFASAPIAFFDMEKVGNDWTYGDDIYVCSTKPNTYTDLTYQYIGDKDKSIKFENGLVAGKDFDIYIKNNEGVGADSSYHYKNGYRILDINALKEGYKATLTTLGYTSLAAALNEADADKQAANREALATVAMSEDVWVYTLDRPVDFSMGNFYNGSGGSQYYRDMAHGSGAENNLVAIFGGPYITKDGDSFLSGTNAKEYIYSTLNRDDIIRAGGGDDVIYGGQGDDQIYAGEGNNRIVFCNNYYLERGYSGGYGNPLIYTLSEGATGRSATDGHDTVYNDGGSDTLDFSENNMVKFEKVGRDLKISYTFEAQEVEEVLTDVATSTVTVKDYFLANGDIDENHSAKYIKFRNRGVVNLADEYVASSGNKYLWSTTPEGENLQGGATTEFIYGGSGNDTLSGGLYLDGGKGNDRYDVSACTTLAPIVISDSGCEQNTIYLDIHKTEFGAFYDVTATKTGETVNTKLGDALHIFNQNNGYNATGGLIVSLGYTSLLDEDFDTSGYDNEVRINQNKQYSTNYTIYSQELNGHYHTSSISSIISETQSWLTSNYDAVAGVLGEENVSTANLMASTADGAAALKADLISTINSHLYWS